jgi:hypothetical protein
MNRYNKLIELNKDELVQYILELENEAIIEVPK